MSRSKLLVILLCQMLRVSMGTQCTRCAPGKFKSPEMFFSPCTLCPQNTFSSFPGAAQCDPCPPYSASSLGSSRCTFEPCRLQNYSMGCVCPIGTTGPDGGPCNACVVGTYKNATGAARCDNCSSTKTSVAGSSSCFCKANYMTTDTGDCMPCMNGMISRENSAVCFCPNGTSLVDGRCVQIYSEGVRLSGFINLETSNITNTSSSIDSLIQQITSSIALQYNISENLVQVIFTSASRNLLQQSGYRTDIIILSESAEAFASVVNKTVDLPMLQDVERTTLPISLNEGNIVLCGKNEISIATACVCSAGYTRELGKCAGCAPGKVKAVGGDMPCEECSNNTFSRTGARQCSLCPFSSTTKKNHTSCSCNTAFVFFNDTCKETESVYLNVTGVLQLPEGEFNEVELQTILLDSFSEYLNFSKEFITIIITARNKNTDNATDMNLTNTSTTPTAVDTSTPPPNTSNSTHNGRRLLYDLTVERIFTALFQIEKNDQTTFTKIQNFTYEAKNEMKTITDANGYRIVVKQADLTPGYFTAAGTALSKCDDGTYPTPDSISKKLSCKAKVIVEVVEKVAQETWAYWAAMGVGVLVLVACVGIHFCRKGQDTLPARYAKLPDSELQRFCGQQFSVTTNKLQVPATVAIEYRLLPGQSI